MMKKSIFNSLTLLACTALMAACSDGGYYDKGDSGSAYPPATDESGDNGGGEGGNTHAGVVTAGEWNDLDHWTFWAGLMTGQEYASMSDYWKFYTNNRIAVSVVDTEGNPVCGATVAIFKTDEQNERTELWSSKTDTFGKTDAWVGLYSKEVADATLLTIEVNGIEQENSPTVTLWSSVEVATNTYTVANPTAPNDTVDIAFIVDATGSMKDEIGFLKDDLTDIIGKVAKKQTSTTIRTAALFYRDEGDDYVTRPSNFTETLQTTSDFIAKQEANGGGDYPEAVHTALTVSLQALSWDDSARARIAFMILDAPPHHTDEVIESIQSSIRLYAENGIKLIPIAASGANKNTEFLLRDFAIATGGTYVFITDDSGVGEEHVKASVGDYTVEQLNDLMVRLINKYIE